MQPHMLYDAHNFSKETERASGRSIPTPARAGAVIPDGDSSSGSTGDE